jgi:hypothetical protein
MKNTIDKIVEESYNKPISLLFVGIGENSFENLKIIDNIKNELTDSKGRKMGRDVVTFVYYDDYLNDKETFFIKLFHEIPFQLVDYMNSKKIVPYIN